MNITCHRKEKKGRKKWPTSKASLYLNPTHPDIQLYRQRDCYVASSLSSTKHDAMVIFNLLATSSCTSPSTFSLKAAISPSVIIAVSVRVGSILPACSTSVAGTTLSSVTITIFTPKLALEKTNSPIRIKICKMLAAHLPACWETYFSESQLNPLSSSIIDQKLDHCSDHQCRLKYKDPKSKIQSQRQEVSF